MSHFNLRYFLQTLGERCDDVFVVQIGAMDGITFDPVHEYITKYGWQGLLVEPLPDQFSKLENTYKGNDKLKFANVAVAEEDGAAIMHRVSDAAVASGDVPRWGYGLGSFYKDRNALAFDDVKELMFEEEVACLSLPSLLNKYVVQEIDVLQIDAEGHDYQILKQLDFAIYEPLVINMEIVNLPKSEQTACKRLLDDRGYIHIKAGYDLLAVSLKFFHKYC